MFFLCFRYIYILVNGENGNPGVLRTELDGGKDVIVASSFTSPAGFVVNGNVLVVAEKFGRDTILTEIDVSRTSTVSTQLTDQVRLVYTET